MAIIYSASSKHLGDIFALSLDGLSSPLIQIEMHDHVHGSHANGWGFGWYPNDNQAAMVMKDPLASSAHLLVDALTDWAEFRSTVFLCKLRGAAKGYSHHEAQPFSRSFAGRNWLFLHNGDLEKKALEKLSDNKSRFLEPLGVTDSELAFCILLGNMQASEARTLLDIAPEAILDWFQRFDALGGSDMVMTEGLTVACFHGTNSPKRIFYRRLLPPDNQDNIDLDVALVKLNDPRDSCRTALIFSSAPTQEDDWIPMEPGQLIIAKRGAIIWKNGSSQTTTTYKPKPPVTVFHGDSPSVAPSYKPTYRLFDIAHTTTYGYTEPVEHSTHVFRLHPVEDPIQEVLQYQLSVSAPGEKIQFDDVFGNQSVHYAIHVPYTHLVIESISRVKVFALPTDDHSLSRRQTSIPLLWMPWQRQMMMAYLLPVELPETQLIELTEYAMSFVERNDYQLLDTLNDINRSIYSDYQYVPGSTSLSTTPFDVYTTRKGVCQDFAHLFICMARLLGIPARYQMGYIFTGANYENKIQSEASHAWVEAYLPYVGWRGFDPTNGCRVGQDHLRVACGRNYFDATPTAGTLYKGGGTETLSVRVKMEEVR